MELWKSGGTTANTILFEDINPSGNSNPGNGSGFVAVGSILYFAADDGNVGIELWETDGGLGNTILSADINPSGSSNPTSLIALNLNLIFVANDGTNGDELWKYDGANATLIQNIQPIGYPDKPYTINNFNNNIYFVADNGTIGKELWKSDGTTASLVKDINIGTSGNSNPVLMDTMGGFAYLGAYENNTGYLSLIKTNGSTVTTTTVKPGNDGGTGFQPFYNKAKALGGNLLFSAFDNANGLELWKTDGTNGGTVLIKDINGGAAWGYPQSFTKVGSLVFFTAETTAEGRELWSTDGTTAGTVLVKDINPGTNTPDIDNMVAMNGKLYFIANDGTNGSELWVSDGTNVGTVMIKNINPGAADALTRGIQNLKAINNVLYFAADDGVNGTELWKSDGTNLGTVLVKDIYPGATSSNPAWFTELNGQIYFDAANGNTGGRLFRSDGTAGGTNLFFNVEFTFLHARVGNKVLFFCYPYAITGNNGFELWGTDGTTTAQVKDFVPGMEGVGYMFIDNFPVYQGRWYFNLDNDGINGLEAWSSDGTTTGTILHDLNPGVASSFSNNFLGVNPMLFSSDDGTTIGRELYKLDLSVLPITGLEFNVQKQNTSAVLNFKTYTEINNKGFIIEHGLNGIKYDSIGFVAAKGINGNGATYAFVHSNPADGKNYYRLKQIDIDGKINYSPIRFVDFSKEVYVKSYPNPTSDILNINTGYNFKNASLKINSYNGQLVKQQVVNGSGTVTINVKDLPPGLYTISIKDELNSVKLVFIKR